MFKIGTDLKITPIAEFRNAWGSAAAVWTVLSAKYLGNESAWLTGERNLQPLWDLWKDPRLSYDERVAHLFTFDGAVVGYETRHEAAMALREFSPNIDPACVNHMDAIAGELEKADECYGFCFHQTSVSENPWMIRQGEDSYVQYDFANGNKHFDVIMSANDYNKKNEQAA